MTELVHKLLAYRSITMLDLGTRRRISNFTIECDESLFVKKLIAYHKIEGSLRKSDEVVPVVIKRVDIYGNQYKDDLDISPYIYNYIQESVDDHKITIFTDNADHPNSTQFIKQHTIQIPESENRPILEVTVRIVYTEHTQLMRLWHIDKVLNCARAQRARSRRFGRANCRNEEDLEFKKIPENEFVMTRAGYCLSRADAQQLLRHNLVMDPYTRQSISGSALMNLTAFADSGILPPNNHL